MKTFLSKEININVNHKSESIYCIMVENLKAERQTHLLQRKESVFMYLVFHSLAITIIKQTTIVEHRALQ